MQNPCTGVICATLLHLKAGTTRFCTAVYANATTTVVFYDLNQIALRFPEDKILSHSTGRCPTMLPSSIWVYKTHQLKWARNLCTALIHRFGDSPGPCLQSAPLCSRWPFRDDTVLWVGMLCCLSWLCRPRNNCTSEVYSQHLSITIFCKHGATLRTFACVCICIFLAYFYVLFHLSSLCFLVLFLES